MSFELLNLPYLAYKEVIKTMGFVDLYHFSLLSKRMEWIVKKEVKVKNYYLDINYHKNLDFCFKSSSDDTTQACILVESSGLEPRETHPTSSRGMPLLSIDRYDVLDVFKGAKEIFKKFVKIPIKSVDINIRTNYQEVVKWLNELQVEHLLFIGDNSDFEVYEWIVTHSTSSPSLMIFIEPTSEVRFPDGTIRSLIDKAEANPKLRYVKLVIHRSIDYPVVLDGLDMKKEPIGWSFLMENGEKCLIENTEYDEDHGVTHQGVKVSIERK